MQLILFSGNSFTEHIFLNLKFLFKKNLYLIQFLHFSTLFLQFFLFSTKPFTKNCILNQKFTINIYFL